MVPVSTVVVTAFATLPAQADSTGIFEGRPRRPTPCPTWRPTPSVCSTRSDWTAPIVGASVGGAIVQTIAIEHPGRVRSLTSMMSTTGELSVGQPTPETLAAVFAGPPAQSRQDVIDRMVRAVRVVGSPGLEVDEAEVADRAGRAYDRAHDPLGIARQAVASVASGDRTARLRSVDLPTLVIHGADDALCDLSGGRATAQAIPGAELVIIDGMGHDLPRALWPEITSRIATLVQHVEAVTASD